MDHQKVTGMREFRFAGRRAGVSALALAVGLAAFAGLASHPARADDQQLQLLEDQIRQLQAQIDALKKEQAQQAQQATTPAPIGSNKPAVGYETGGHQFGWTSADGQDSIELTGRVHVDTGYYAGQSLGPGLLTGTQRLTSGADLRRARLGVTGKFAGDFNYTLIAEFGGSEDGTNPLNSGAASTEIENAFISYNGLNNPNSSVPLAIDVGYLDVPWGEGQVESSNDYMFLEAPSIDNIATTGYGGYDYRAAIGARSYKTQYWVGAYVTGPEAGTPHTNTVAASSTLASQTVPSGEPLAGLLRASYNPIQDDNESLHAGVDLAYLIHPGSTTTTAATGTVTGNGNSVTFSDRPELRIDPTSILSTGAITDVRSGQAYGGELAGYYGPVFADGEIWDLVIQRYGNPATTPLLASSFNFTGGFAEASYSIGGTRHYNPVTGYYTGVIPDAPLSLKEGGGWGALEFAVRYSNADLNDKFTPNKSAATEVGIEGGDQNVYSLGVNWYLNSNMRIMLDYLHAEISKYTTAAASSQAGAKFDAIATRFQVTW